MLKFTKAAFVLAPICLIISLICDYVFDLQAVKSFFIALTTLLLIAALIGKAVEVRKTEREEDDA